MGEIKLTAEEMRYIVLLQDITGASARDCIVDNENSRVIFVVKPGDAGKAIGRRGSNINMLRKVLGKDVDIVEYADNLEAFVKNVFTPARIINTRLIERGRKKLLYITVDPNDKGKAIGRRGRKVALARLILKRYYDIDEIKIK